MISASGPVKSQSTYCSVPVHGIQVADVKGDGHVNHCSNRALYALTIVVGCINVTCSQQLSMSRANWTCTTTMASILKAIKNIASGNKPRRLRPPNTPSDDSSTVPDLVSLPNAIPGQYPPLILIHVILLSAALVLLPQTPIPDLPLPSPTRGLDKPQPPFLAPITARPVLTLVWACLGAVLLVPWWAGSLRRWAHDGTLAPVASSSALQVTRIYKGCALSVPPASHFLTPCT
jgi:hypothetical protein